MTEYIIAMETPLGSKRGTMYINISPPVLSGQLRILRGTEPLYGVIDEHGFCTLRGKIKTLMREIDYTATGTIGRKIMELTVRGGSNIFQITGTARDGQEE